MPICWISWPPVTLYLTSLSVTQLQLWAPTLHVKSHLTQDDPVWAPTHIISYLTQDDPVWALGSHLQSHDIDLAQCGWQLSLCQPVLVELADYEEPWGRGLHAAR